MPIMWSEMLDQCWCFYMFDWLSWHCQANNKMEFVFASHSFDVCESWMLEGSLSKCCKLINRKNSSVCLFVITILNAYSKMNLTYTNAPIRILNKNTCIDTTMCLFIPFLMAKIFCRLYWRSILRSSEPRVKKMVWLGGLINISDFFRKKNRAMLLKLLLIRCCRRVRSAPYFSIAKYSVLAVVLVDF